MCPAEHAAGSSPSRRKRGELGHHVACEEFERALRLGKGHIAEGEPADEIVHARLRDLLCERVAARGGSACYTETGTLHLVEIVWIECIDGLGAMLVPKLHEA